MRGFNRLVAVCYRRQWNHANARPTAAAPDTAAERDQLKAINADLLAALENTRKSLGYVLRATVAGDPAKIPDAREELWAATNLIAAAIARAKGDA